RKWGILVLNQLRHGRLKAFAVSGSTANRALAAIGPSCHQRSDGGLFHVGRAARRTALGVLNGTRKDRTRAPAARAGSGGRLPLLGAVLKSFYYGQIAQTVAGKEKRPTRLIPGGLRGIGSFAHSDFTFLARQNGTGFSHCPWGQRACADGEGGGVTGAGLCAGAAAG